MNSRTLTILSGGAAQGLIDACAPVFKTQTGCDIEGTFGAVGAMRDKLLGGAAADLLILTSPLIAELEHSGHVVAHSAVDLGPVATAIAVRAGDAAPSVADEQGLRAALLAADEIYFPDPTQATAGIHFAKVIARLGIMGQVAQRLRTFPNGATAMRAMATAASARAIGCTQATEILNTQGVRLVAALPKGFELITMYTAGICSKAALPEQARALVAMLAGDANRAAREKAGFG
jgi:molybdate transport system substrate-binding protein